MPRQPEKMQEAGRTRERRSDFPCEFCESSTAEGVVDAATWGSQGLVIAEDIPAGVCEKCGERVYSHEAARKIADMTPGSPATRAKRRLVVPVYSFAEIGLAER